MAVHDVPRLKLLQKLLSEDGFIFISIDVFEYANLKCIMDEIFGISNFRNCIAVRRGIKMYRHNLTRYRPSHLGTNTFICTPKIRRQNYLNSPRILKLKRLVSGHFLARNRPPNHAL